MSINTTFEFDPFAGPEVLNSFPTIESQLEIWTACQIGGDDANRAFNESVSVKFEGNLDKAAFDLALSSLLERHEALRAAFTEDGSSMLIFKTLPLNYEFSDISNLTADEKNKFIEDSKIQEVLNSFDLLNGPLFKFNLIKLSEESYFFTVTAHHIICDGWSIGLLIQDLSKLYSAYTQNLMPDLPLANKFSDYAVEQIKFSKSSEYQKNENFWLGQFSKYIPVLNIPTDHIRPNPRTYKSSRIDFSIDHELINSLKLIGIKEGCSLVNTLLASFELFLHAYTGQEDIIIGLPTAGQLVSGYYSLVGHCVSLLPIRSYPNAQFNFHEYLKVRKSAILDAFEHQRLTFGSLIKKLQLPRQSSRIPLVPVVFNIDTEMESDTNFYNLNFELYSNPREFENFELYLNIWNNKKGIQLEWSYNSQLFERSTIIKMMQDFELLLRSIVSDPNQKLEQLLRLHPIHSPVQLTAPVDNISNELDLSRSYYLQLFSGELGSIDFPYDHLRGGQTVPKLVEFNHTFSSPVFSNLIQFQISHNVSKSAILLSLVEVFLYKYTSNIDFIVGYKSASHKTIAIRQNISSEKSFNEILNYSTGNIVAGLKHQAYTLSNLLRELSLPPQSGGNGLFDIKISIEDTDTQEIVDFPEEAIGVQDLHFKFKQGVSGIELKLIYNETLIESATASRICLHIENLLQALLAQPNELIKKIEYLSVLERQELLERFNDTKKAYPNTETVVSLFESQVSQTPKNRALVYLEKSYSYDALNSLSNQLGDFLRKEYAIESDDLIGIQLERSEWLIIAILGVLKSGGAYVPIDPEYPQERIDYLKTNSQCKVVIDLELLTKFQLNQSQYRSSNLSHINKPSDLVYVIYTSGSTGQPKGVMVENRNVVRLVKSTNYIDLNGSEVLLSTGAISFDATTFEYWSMLLNGGTLVLCSQKTLLDFKLLSEEIKKQKIEIMWFTAGWLNQLVDADINLFEGLKVLLAGGDKLSSVHINKLINRYPQLKIINGYGPTENTTFSLTYGFKGPLENIPIGQPISNSSAYILDRDDKLAPIGVNGEIVLGGDGVSRGYLNQAQLTNEKFIDNPFNPSQKLYRSGDIGRWQADGNIQFIGRKDFQIKLRGYRIELGEIENILTTYPGIIDSIVTIIDGKQQDSALIGYYVSNIEIDREVLREFMKSKLPSYMVPSFFIKLNEMPLTNNGKIDRKQLPGLDEINLGNLTVSNFNQTQSLLVGIWNELLGLKNIKISDNFFEIGGHSLIAIRLILKLEKEIGIKLPMSSLFEFPTIEKLAKFIDTENSDIKWKCLVPIQPDGDKLPVYLVHGGGLGVLIFINIVKHLDKNQPVYGLQALGIDGQDEPLDSIEEMAKYYISEILQQNPTGPYSVAGLSAGGLIAFEIAQQLKSMGKKIKLLAVFDFDLYEIEKYNNNDTKSKIKRLFKNIFPSISYFFKSLMKYPKKTYEYYLMCWQLRFISFKRRLGFKNQVVLDTIHNDLQTAMEKNDIAFKKYILKPYDENLDLFIAKKKVYFQKDPKFMGWKAFVNGEINVHQVEGDHDDMILPPNNKNFAAVLQKILDRNKNDKIG